MRSLSCSFHKIFVIRMQTDKHFPKIVKSIQNIPKREKYQKLENSTSLLFMQKKVIFLKKVSQRSLALRPNKL